MRRFWDSWVRKAPFWSTVPASEKAGRYSKQSRRTKIGFKRSARQAPCCREATLAALGEILRANRAEVCNHLSCDTSVLHVSFVFFSHATLCCAIYRCWSRSKRLRSRSPASSMLFLSGGHHLRGNACTGPNYALHTSTCFCSLCCGTRRGLAGVTFSFVCLCDCRLSLG